MKIKDIQIDGFGVWTGLSVDSMPEGMTLFYGPNEAGKTTLMQFIRAMLYGFTQERREKYLPPIHGGTPGGALRVTGPGGGYEIRRTSQLTDNSATGRLTVTGQDGLSQGQHRLGSLLGQIDEPIFTNVFAIGIRELQELSTLDGTAAADELYKLSSGLDRVSLVDVLRGLRAGRQDLVGQSGGEQEQQQNRLFGMLKRRENLRREVEQLTRHSRRWTELASQRRAQQHEIEQLSERMGSWEKEAKCVETATSVLDTWQQRDALQEEIRQTELQTELPDEAPGQLVQIDAMMDERRAKLEEIKAKRREVREKAEQLPVSRRMLELQGRIEAATEQATWVEALEEQIERLDAQVDKARKQLESDADRLGIDEEDRAAICRGDLHCLPDLSKQTLTALAEPARNVKEAMYALKQARNEGLAHKKKADQLREDLDEVLRRANANNLQQAIRQQNDRINVLRQRIQLGEHLDKLKRHYRDLERESVDLATDEALPVDRMLLLGVPFFAGGALLMYGLFHLLNIQTFVAQPDPTYGMLYLTLGMIAMLIFYMGRENGRRANSLDLEDCERQIESIRRQIRDLESEANDVDASLPSNAENLQQRLRDAESLAADLDAALPTYHSQAAADQAYKSARSRASKAADDLKASRRAWASTLERLGLSESMSPQSVRKLGDGYETLQASIRRVDELKAEREQRQREMQTLAKRIEDLYLEALEVQRESVDEDALMYEDDEDDKAQQQRIVARPRTGPLDQLNHLQEELSRQRHWIKRRRTLKDQDDHYKKQQAGHARAIERGEQQRRALWAKCGVATAEQFYELVDAKARLREMRIQIKELDQQVRKIIGTHVDYDEVATAIDGATAQDLDKRWESLTTRMTETEERVALLRTQQGQLAQEMKQLGEDGRLTVAQLELECLDRQIASATRRWQTLAMASSLLEDVCSTVERERQPETLREASSFLSQLTDGKYTRIWTPLGTSKLKIDDAEGNSLPLEVLSRGTGEAVFIALRLSLAAAYSRRGVMLPLVLDDVLVNFDRERAVSAARTLKTFAELGHQVMMFTCHDHIVEIFHDIDVQVRQLPTQGEPGRAEVLPPPVFEEEPVEYEEEEITVAEPVVELEEEQPEVVTPRIQFIQKSLKKPQTKTVVVEKPVPVPAEPKVIVQPAPPKPEPKPEPAKPRPLPQPKPEPRPEPEPVYEYIEEVEYLDDEPESSSLDWAWFQREPADGRIDDDEAVAEIARSEWVGDESLAAMNTNRHARRDVGQPAHPGDAPGDDGSWWDGARAAS
ncbi:AAA family ATPase [Crateriforma conspicua]|uniref:Chromosome partition protein Smc n=1 Tax=Crateriforma conspicua TaxID=2527996 RepID=A0A5C5Y9U7_9PLAN|nr:AAA family ATPase [Crateriforma conspicua]TWT71904.1 Chromosome partition protein Smc [Crateriforma conspicua]